MDSVPGTPGPDLCEVCSPLSVCLCVVCLCCVLCVCVRSVYERSCASVCLCVVCTRVFPVFVCVGMYACIWRKIWRKIWRNN